MVINTLFYESLVLNMIEIFHTDKIRHIRFFRNYYLATYKLQNTVYPASIWQEKGKYCCALIRNALILQGIPSIILLKLMIKINIAAF